MRTDARDDMMRTSLPAAGFDCVVSIAALHHLPTERALQKMTDALAPGGTLIIHDLLADDRILDRGISALVYPVSVARRFWKTGRLRAPRAMRAAWAEHGAGETYLTSAEVRAMCGRYLPGAVVKRHLLWRYTIVWRKPGAN